MATTLSRWSHAHGRRHAQVQAMLGHASIDTSARYFRSGSAENAAIIERVFGN